MTQFTAALAGNPNVGKSSVFNALTGLHQHTGNWAGKTVSTARGTFRTAERDYSLIDLPGTYSLSSHSEEEQIARDYLASGEADAVIVICDATCLQRSLHLALQCLSITGNVILCVNLMDEAEKRGIKIDLKKLSALLDGIPVVGCTARKKTTLHPLLTALDHFAPHPEPLIESTDPREIAKHAEMLFHQTVTEPQTQKKDPADWMGSFLSGTVPGILCMLMALGALLWITILGANAVSDLLSAALEPVGRGLESLLKDTPEWLRGAVVDGAWCVLSWVVAVMLPPMAIFFPLFTLLEDAGVLPRIAFAMDHPLQRCGACGKQALTCCMGLGCNAAGVIGCRIIDSPRERLLAILTNCLTPCSGRFPMLAVLTTVIFCGKQNSVLSAAAFTVFIILSLCLSFFSTRILSKTVLHGMPSAFTLELPPFRRPQIGKVLVRSVLDRTIVVLGRAAAVAAPAGLIIWMIANISSGGVSLLQRASDWLEPIGRIMGLDGIILLAFLLGIPANEIVLPLILMGYLASSTIPTLQGMESVRAVLIANHWTWETACCTALFTIAHWPCSTTIMTIYKETGSVRWTMLGVLLPTMLGASCCILFHSIVSAIQAAV